MKRILAALLVVMFMLSLAACGNQGAIGGKSKPVSMNDLMNAFRNAGYGVRAQSEELTAEEFGLERFAPQSCDGFLFGQEDEPIERSGMVYYFVFNSASDAEAAFDALRKIICDGGVNLQSVKGTNGLKARYIKEKADYGGVAVLSQWDNTIIYACEDWDIDVKGYSYDDRMENIINKVGY